MKRLLDGELRLAELPPDLRAEGEEALRLLGAVDRTPVTLSPAVTSRVMATVRERTRSPARRAWRWLVTPRNVEVRFRIRPWLVAPALAAAAALVLVLARPQTPVSSTNVVFVRFMLHAPGAKSVTVAGTFNQWDQNAAPLIPAGTDGVWTTTLALPVGQHQYAFVVDGRRWVADPAAPAIDDGFGRRNSVVAVTRQGARTL
ncbi:MAG TPA: isoamylase early set domain-containing protein [Gemmatimonadales bacterium]|nr:isoamylase early set domain-containing protein [Gemmatimonadales bacterium]